MIYFFQERGKIKLKKTKKTIIVALIGISIYILVGLCGTLLGTTQIGIDLLIWIMRNLESIGLLIYFSGILWILQKRKGKIKEIEEVLKIFIILNLMVTIVLFFGGLNNFRNDEDTGYHLIMVVNFIFQIIFTIYIYEITSKKIGFLNNKVFVVSEICYLIVSLIIGIIENYNVVSIILWVMMEAILYLSTLKYFYNYYNVLKNRVFQNEEMIKCTKCAKNTTTMKFIINDGICDDCLKLENGKKVNPKKGVNKMQDWKKICMVIAVIFLILSSICLCQGFDKIMNYKNSDTYTYNNVNAYVGGDAYNYIINAGYFAGFVSLGGCLLIISAIFMTTAIKLDKN